MAGAVLAERAISHEVYSTKARVEDDSLEKRRNFFTEITYAQKGGWLQFSIDFEAFSTRYKGLYPDNLITDGYYHLKREQYAGFANNAINYLTDYVQARRLLESTDPILAHENAIRKIMPNLLSAATEYPLSQATKTDERIERWTDSWRLLDSHSGRDMEEVLIDALTSSQVDTLIQARCAVNRKNYLILAEGRGLDDKRVFVEFSPRPLQEKDGYFNDCIFFYIFDPSTRQEKIVQRWLKAPLEEFVKDLLPRLGIYLEPDATDADVMNSSYFVSPEQLDYIEAFIDNHHGRLTAHKTVLDQYVWGELRTFLVNDLAPIFANTYSKFDAQEDLSFELSEIVNSLKLAQLKLNNKIMEITDLRTTAMPISAAEFQILETNRYYRRDFMEENNIQLRDCPQGLGQRSIFGKASGITSQGEQSVLKCVQCPFCKNTVDAVISGGKITCPSCNASSPYTEPQALAA